MQRGKIPPPHRPTLIGVPHEWWVDQARAEAKRLEYLNPPQGQFIQMLLDLSEESRKRSLREGLQ